jgi:hypothetical protein
MPGARGPWDFRAPPGRHGRLGTRLCLVLHRVGVFVSHYWSVGLLAGGAVVFLVAGRTTAEALAAAGFAFIGAAVTRAVDIGQDRRMEVARLEAQRRADLDETRRLCYGALSVATSPGNPMLTATLVNALAHHGLDVDPEEAARFIPQVVSGNDASVGAQWLREQMERINNELTGRA